MVVEICIYQPKTRHVEAFSSANIIFTAGKSGKVPYGKLKKYYRNQDLVSGGGNNTTQPDYDETPSNKVENLQYYYHPDQPSFRLYQNTVNRMIISVFCFL